MKKSKKKNIGFYVLALLLVVGLVGGIVYTTDFGDSLDGYNSFSVAYDDILLTDNLDNQVFGFNTELRFDVTYDYSKLCLDKNYDYTVSVLPCGDFDFTVDGNIYSWSQEEDITNAFNVQKNEGYFTITIPGSAQDVLEVIYPEAEIIVPALDEAVDYYKLTVTAHDGATVLSVSFKQYSSVIGITLSSASLEF